MGDIAKMLQNNGKYYGRNISLLLERNIPRATSNNPVVYFSNIYLKGLFQNTARNKPRVLDWTMAQVEARTLFSENVQRKKKKTKKAKRCLLFPAEVRLMLDIVHPFHAEVRYV